MSATTEPVARAEAIEAVLESLRETLAVIEASASMARSEATSEESKQEGKYDTRAIEAGYLAGAQARRALVSAAAIGRIDGISRHANTTGVIDGPCLVELEDDGGEVHLYLLAPCAGGLLAHVRGSAIRVITPESPLGEALIGAEVDDDVRPTGVATVWTVLAIR